MGLRIWALRLWWAESEMGGLFQSAFKFLAVIAGVVFVLGYLSAWGGAGFFFLILIASPILVFAVATGAIFLAKSAVEKWHLFANIRLRLLALLIGPAMVMAAVLLFLPMLWTGSWLGDLSRLTVNYTKYEAIIVEAERHRRSEWYAESRGVTYNVDVGPPVRVAFNPAGFLDNWSGIVFDPSGEVMLADGFDENGTFAAPDRITKIFGGDLVSCHRLWSDYYSCSFT